MSPRPFRCRKISGEFAYRYFKPNGIPMSELEEVAVTPDELEALRLADLEGMYQADAAEKMGISRQTFGNIINSVHSKIADAILNGKAICAKDPDENTHVDLYRCPECGHAWEKKDEEKARCPECNNETGSAPVIENGFLYKPNRCRRGRVMKNQ